MRLGVLGLGKVAQLHHLPNLVASPRVELAGVCDRSPALASTIAERYCLPASAATADLADLLNRDIHGLVVANRHHGPVVVQALAAGVHVFVEKPACWGLEEGEALLDAERRAGKAVVVGYMKRFDPAVERLVEEQREAPPHYVRLHTFAGGRHRQERLHRTVKPTDLTSDQVAAESEAVDEVVTATLGSGCPDRVDAFRTLAELAIHNLNIARALLGELTLDSGRRFVTPWGAGYLALLEASGVPVTLEVVPDFETARDWDDVVVLHTATGSVELSFGSPFVTHAPTTIRERFASGTDVVERHVLVSRDSPYRRELEHFVDCVLGVTAPRTTLDEAVSDIELVGRLVAGLEMP